MTTKSNASAVAKILEVDSELRSAEEIFNSEVVGIFG